MRELIENTANDARPWRIRVLPTTPADVAALLARGLRRADVLESVRVSGLPAGDALRLSVVQSVLAATVWADGQVIAICGVGERGVLSGIGVPWFLAHDDFEHPAIAPVLARVSRRFIECWLRRFTRLENVADPEHDRAMRYLAWLGFSFDRQHLIRGPFGHPLVRFWRQQCVPPFPVG